MNTKKTELILGIISSLINPNYRLWSDPDLELCNTLFWADNVEMNKIFVLYINIYWLDHL